MRSFLFVYRKKITAVFYAILFFTSAIFSWRQYSIWQSHDVSKFLLPPFRDNAYFFSYIFFKFWAPFLIAIAVGLVFLLLSLWYNKKKQDKIFYKEEPWIIAMILGSLSWPIIIIYIPAFFIIFVIGVIIKTIIKGTNSRMSPRFLWIPIALFVILISELWLSHTPLWGLIKI